MEPLNRIARPTKRLDRLYHEYLKPLGENPQLVKDEQLFKLFANALVQHGLIELIFDLNGEGLRYYKTVRGTEFQGTQLIKQIAKSLVEGIPFESVTPESHLRSVVTDFDCADLGIIEDVEFLLNDNGTVKSINVGGVDMAPYVNKTTLEDIAEDLREIESEQRIAERINLGIQKLKRGEF